MFYWLIVAFLIFYFYREGGLQSLLVSSTKIAFCIIAVIVSVVLCRSVFQHPLVEGIVVFFTAIVAISCAQLFRTKKDDSKVSD
tara:strand:- start:987 stop:1238 length:252 start_codon:yes stop_codon:yes gene_type:complete